ncbi:hypothetical protein BJX66DRAFT_320419 [Aspergillus keveii]|uniref:Uncharacterized protein n=1 Tax=Aspergillus keveii TaxID=714993 RepID=A0ABR4FH31_9EURO
MLEPRQSHTVNKIRSLVGILFVVDKALPKSRYQCRPATGFNQARNHRPQVRWVGSATNIFIEMPQQREDSAWASGCPRTCSMVTLGCERAPRKLGLVGLTNTSS